MALATKPLQQSSEQEYKSERRQHPPGGEKTRAGARHRRAIGKRSLRRADPADEHAHREQEDACREGHDQERRQCHENTADTRWGDAPKRSGYKGRDHIEAGGQAHR